MTDLIARLRAAADSAERDYYGANEDLMREAADAIATLTRERDEAYVADAQKTREWNLMSQEARKYYAALKDIFNVPGVDGRVDVEAVRRGQDMRASEQMRMLAAQAIGLSTDRAQEDR